VRRQRFVAPILALLVIAMLGNSSMACACALAALDTPAQAHHGMSGDHAASGIDDEHDCGTACGNHAVSAPGSKATDAGDHRTEKPLFPPVHHGERNQVLEASLPSPSRYEKQHPPLPLSTPVSRSDTLLD
jgi:hypothetical protein